MAIRIQKNWRGYYSRNYIHSFYDRKRYLKSISNKNNEMRLYLNENEIMGNKYNHHLQSTKSKVISL